MEFRFLEPYPNLPGAQGEPEAAARRHDGMEPGWPDFLGGGLREPTPSLFPPKSWNLPAIPHVGGKVEGLGSLKEKKRTMIVYEDAILRGTHEYLG